MATCFKHGKKWQAQVRNKGFKPRHKTFPTKKEGLAWIEQIEYEQKHGLYIDTTLAEKTTFEQLIDRFYRQVTLKGNNADKEKSRMKHLYKHLGYITLDKFTSVPLAEYRDMRLEVVEPATVLQELALINRILKKAHGEWGIYIPHGVPSVSRPKLPPGRDRRLEGDEEENLRYALKDTPTVLSIFLFDLETALRRGELCQIKWSHLNLGNHTLFVPDTITKTGVSRTIPLSKTAMKILKDLPRRSDDYIIGVRPDGITQAFGRACKRADINDLRFHDIRHEATSRLFEKGLNMMEVSSITGHKDLRMLKRYTHLRAEDLVSKLK